MLEHRWYRPSLDVVTFLLLPFSWIFRFAVFLRRYFYQKKILKSFKFSVPVIVVGNITVGGTGKTPFVIWLADFLQQNHFRPGIVSRGVGGQQQKNPRWVDMNSDPALVGDEAVLLAKRSGAPVVIGVDRVAAVKELLSKSNCNIVISDDGLQHYRLARDLEIVIVDGDRQFGNHQLLPAGPLREPVSRLKTVDVVIENGKSMKLVGGHLVSLDQSQKISLADFKNQKVHAVAAIGNPARFFETLRAHQISLVEHIFPDHYLFQKNDFDFGDDLPIVMTEKDAVKCFQMNLKNAWYLPVEAVIDKEVEALLNKCKKAIVLRSKTT
jgi:tetraacyldisaccharide 4'-kinase